MVDNTKFPLLLLTISMIATTIIIIIIIIFVRGEPGREGAAAELAHLRGAPGSAQMHKQE